jgi:hypothetical protein
MNVICLITFKPAKIWCDFLNLFRKYKIFIIVDDNNFELYDFKNNYKNINFIQIQDDICKLNGYINTNFVIKKLISGWDKALYYFGVKYNNYHFIWFMEDDVFFYNENTIVNIDNQYLDHDLLSNTYYENSDGNKKTWLWEKINIQYEPPYYHGMMCSVRFSKSMMKYINDYAKKNNTLFFLEALFPTIAIKNNLKYNNPNEFNNIYYRHNFKKKNIDKDNLYHPVKKLNNHIYFR